MNKIEAIQCEYINCAWRTIETILLIDKLNNDKQKVVYLYNYEGIHFRIFSSLIELSNFLQGEDYKILAEFDKDKDVDKFLSALSIK